MSEGNTTDMEIRETFYAVKKESELSNIKNIVLKVHFIGQNFAQNYSRSYPTS